MLDSNFTCRDLEESHFKNLLPEYAVIFLKCGAT
jgi:hypothetical protein